MREKAKDEFCHSYSFIFKVINHENYHTHIYYMYIYKTELKNNEY